MAVLSLGFPAINKLWGVREWQVLRIGLGLGIRWLPRPAWQMPWSFGTQHLISSQSGPGPAPLLLGRWQLLQSKETHGLLIFYSDLYLFWSWGFCLLDCVYSCKLPWIFYRVRPGRNKSIRHNKSHKTVLEMPLAFGVKVTYLGVYHLSWNL